MLGLEPPHRQERARIPSRGQVADLLRDGGFPEGAVYVGQGHHCIDAGNPLFFVAGHDCTSDEVMPLYIDHIMRNFGTELHSILGKTLVCDFASDELCEADGLAGWLSKRPVPTPQHLIQGVQECHLDESTNSGGIIRSTMVTIFSGGHLPQVLP